MIGGVVIRKAESALEFYVWRIKPSFYTIQPLEGKS